MSTRSKAGADTIRETYSFAAAGWLQIYHFGVGKALQDAGLSNNTNIRFAGSSAGSLACAGIVSRVDLDDMRDYSLECCVDCRSQIQNAFKIREFVRVGIHHFAVSKFQNDVGNQHRKRLEDQLEVYVTVLPQCRKKIISEFETVDDLEEALLASCCITPLAGWPFPLRKTGELVCDGGLAAFQPRKGEPNVVTVSPFYFTTADIKPDVFIPAWWGLYPPAPDQYFNVFNIGYNDAVHFLVRTNRVSKRMLRRLKPTMGHKNFIPPTFLPSESTQLREEEQHKAGFVSRVVFAATGVSGIGSSLGGVDQEAVAEKVALAHTPTAFVGVVRSIIKMSFQMMYLSVDLVAAVVFFCMMRPVALFVIYGELFCVSALCFWAAVLQHIPFVGRKLRHTRRVERRLRAHNQKANRENSVNQQQLGEEVEEEEAQTLRKSAVDLMNSTVVYTYRGAWKELYLVWRNIVSLRVLMHVLLGTHVEINARRLEKHSRLYRVLRPFL